MTTTSFSPYQEELNYRLNPLINIWRILCITEIIVHHVFLLGTPAQTLPHQYKWKNYICYILLMLNTKLISMENIEVQKVHVG